MLAQAQSEWVPFVFGVVGFLASLVTVAGALRAFRPLARWVWRKIVAAVATELIGRMDEIDRKVTPNGGTEHDSVATAVLRLGQQVADLAAEVRSGHRGNRLDEPIG